MKKFLLAICTTLSLSSCSHHLLIDDGEANSNTTNLIPKNIIFIVGDGMGPAYTTAYRYYKDNPNTEEVEKTVFDRHLVGLSSTYPASISGYVTDSAAGATALATGIKSYNGAIGVDVNKNEVQTVLELAKTLGKKIGVVVTSQVNHATPASFLTHNESRKNYNEIADSYFDEKIKGQFKMDLLLGGGWKYFLRDDRDLINEFKLSGFQYIDTYQQLGSIKRNKPVIGLFADVGLPWALDDTDPYRLSAMTKVATTQLENDNGFFMLIEASQIDWAGHSNDIAAAMAEMDDLAKTLEYLEKYVAQNPDTLVVVTADHSTGGLTVAANGNYEWNPDVIRTMKYTPKTIADKLSHQDITATLTEKLFNFDLTEQELASLVEVKNDSFVKAEEIDNPYKDKGANKINRELYKRVKHIMDKRTNTGWTSSGHTAVDVPVFAFGVSSRNFVGLNNNTDIANKIFTLLGRN